MMKRLRNGHPREAVVRAYRKKCHLRCEHCQRKCPTEHVYSHVFDCCDDRVVHILRSTDLEPMIIPEPMRKGYAAGSTRMQWKPLEGERA